MAWETAGVIAEVVAAIAVVVSLWYLAKVYDLAGSNWRQNQ
jgi:hypothetical protein